MLQVPPKTCNLESITLLELLHQHLGRPHEQVVDRRASNHSSDGSQQETDGRQTALATRSHMHADYALVNPEYYWDR